jgi:F0F1-type ATP synthase assembly protein I
MNELSETSIRGDSEKSGGAAFRRGKPVQEASRYHTLAIEIAIAVIAPTLAGHWLDTRTGKEPWFTIAGLVLGAAAAARSVQRVYGESLRDSQAGAETSETELSE